MEGNTTLGRGSRAVTQSLQVSADSTGTSEADMPFKVVQVAVSGTGPLDPKAMSLDMGHLGKKA